jgi:hypothetical protein
MVLRRMLLGTALETTLYLPVKRFLEKLGFEVEGEKGRRHDRTRDQRNAENSPRAAGPVEK